MGPCIELVRRMISHGAPTDIPIDPIAGFFSTNMKNNVKLMCEACRRTDRGRTTTTEGQRTDDDDGTDGRTEKDDDDDGT